MAIVNNINLSRLPVLIFVMAIFCAGSFAQTSGTQMIDVYIEWGNADYLDLSGKQVLSADKKHPNLESFVVGYKAWNLMGEFAYNPSFYYEIDRTSLSGKTQIVVFDKISKYPDLAKRYKAMRPSSVNFVITADLVTKDGKAKTVNFKVSHNDLGYTGSRSAINVQSPTSPANGKWKSVFSTTALTSTSFTDADYSDEKELKELLKNFAEIRPCSSGCRGAVKISFDIKWADDAIDEIGRLYDQYENENKKIDDELKAVKEADKLVKPVAAYNKDDEMSAPFEEEAKSAEVFKNGETVGLRAKGKVVFSSDAYSSAEALDGKMTLFSFNSRKGGYHLIDAKGKRLNVEGNSEFRRIKAGDRAGTYKLYAVTDEDFYKTKNIYFGYPSTDKGYRTQQEFDAFVTRDKAMRGGSEYGNQYNLSRGILYTVDEKLKVLSTETVYY